MIRNPEIRVLDDEKKLLGLMSAADALVIARQRGMDLVEIAPLAQPPVCRIMDYGKFLYELHKKEHEAKKNQKQVQIKEIKFRPKISVHDYTFKLNHVKRFLEEGNKVKIGHQVLDKVALDCDGLGKLDGGPRRLDWAVSALLVPTKTGGKDAKAKNPQGSPQEVPGDRPQEDRPQEGQ
jgi:translation initiation factor IF-3